MRPFEPLGSAFPDPVRKPRHVVQTLTFEYPANFLLPPGRTFCNLRKEGLGTFITDADLQPRIDPRRKHPNPLPFIAACWPKADLERNRRHFRLSPSPPDGFLPKLWKKNDRPLS